MVKQLFWDMNLLEKQKNMVLRVFKVMPFT